MATALFHGICFIIWLCLCRSALYTAITKRIFAYIKRLDYLFLTTFLIEASQFVFKTGVVDIDDLMINTMGSLVGIFLYIGLRKILQWKQVGEIHEVIDTVATILPPIFVAFVIEMFFGDGSTKLFPVHGIILTVYGICDYLFLIKDFSWKSKLLYAVFYAGIFWLTLIAL